MFFIQVTVNIIITPTTIITKINNALPAQAEIFHLIQLIFMTQLSAEFLRLAPIGRLKQRALQWINIFLIYSQQILMRRYTKQEKGTKSDNNSAKATEEHANSPNKITLHFPTQVQHYQEDDNTNPVIIYLRSPSKKSFRVEVPAKISISDIKILAEERMAIRKDKQLLHLNGKNVTEYGYIRLQPKNIIHIASSDDLLNPEQQITLKVKIIDSFRKNATENKTYTIRTNLNASELLEQIKKEREQLLENSQQKPFFYFLESSRLLEREKSFYQQDISKNTEIICLVTQHELKTRFSNDTKEEILHDISQLLGFEEEPVEKPPPRNERAVRPRYPREERRHENTATRSERFKTVENNRINEVPEAPQELEDSTNLSKTLSTPNFKKKKQILAKTFSAEMLQRPLATKIKASKSKRELEMLLQSQEKQKSVFELPDVVKETAKEESKKDEEAKKDDEAEQSMEIHKPAPSIPKVMPVQERRKIRLEIQKLFDLTDAPELPEPKEEEKPKSPPTEQPSPRPEKERQKMRFSMGSRPAFLDQLRRATPIQ